MKIKYLSFILSILMALNIHAAGLNYKSLKLVHSFGNSSRGVTEIKKIACDKYNNVFVAGSTTSDSDISSKSSFAGGGCDAFVAMFDSAGKLKWSKYFGGEAVDYATDIIISINEKIFITGLTTSKKGIAFGNAWQKKLIDTLNAFIAAFDTSGNQLWSTYIPSSSNTQILPLHYLDPTLTSDTHGNVIMAGSFFILNENDDSTYICKFRENGSLEWNNAYSYTDYSHYYYDNRLFKLVTDKADNIYAIGKTNVSDCCAPYASQGIVVKFDSLGYVRRQLPLTSDQDFHAWVGDLAMTSHGLLVKGFNSQTRTFFDVLDPALLTSPNIYSAQAYDYNLNTWTFSMALDSKENIFLITNDISNWDDDTLICLSSDFKKNLFSVVLDKKMTEQLALDKNDNLYYSFNQSLYEYKTRYYEGIVPGTKTIGIQIFPNPAENECTLSIQVEKPGAVEVIIHNMLGAVLYSKHIPGESMSLTQKIDVSFLPNGLYIVEVQTDEGLGISKLEVIR